jgi:predicted transcriptional regulator
MEIHFPAEIDEQLNHLASESGRGKEDLVLAMVSNQLSYDAWFQREVDKGIASMERGEFVEHAEVGKRLERIFGA